MFIKESSMSTSVKIMDFSKMGPLNNIFLSCSYNTMYANIYNKNMHIISTRGKIWF